MSTSDQQEQRPLTRRQLRELRETGATAVVTPAMVEAATSPAGPEAAVAVAGEQVSPAETSSHPVGSLVSDESLSAVPDAAQHSGRQGATPALTRRELRELSRTSEVGTVVPDSGDESAKTEDRPDAQAESEEAESSKSLFSFLKRRRETDEPEAIETEPDAHEPEAGEHERVEYAQDERVDAADEPTGANDEPTADDADETGGHPDADDAPEPVDAPDVGDDDTPATDDASPKHAVADDAPTDEPSTDDRERGGLDPRFGESVLVEEPAASGAVPRAFNEFVTPLDTTGSQHIAPASLIFTQPSGQPSLSGPIDAGGDILVTGSYELPSMIGSHGHAPGTTDGKDVDAVLVDSELAPASSPVPVAASSAISTLKPAGEVIRQPAPEKGGKLLMGLALTAGGLMIALSVALILAFTNGVF